MSDKVSKSREIVVVDCDDDVAGDVVDDDVDDVDDNSVNDVVVVVDAEVDGGEVYEEEVDDDKVVEVSVEVGGPTFR